MYIPAIIAAGNISQISFKIAIKLIVSDQRDRVRFV